jgi:protoheme IX farnesyltransferase
VEKFKKFFISSKPGIAIFVGITALASAYLGSSDPKRDILKIIFVGLGVVLSAGGSAIINNVLDRELDKLMTRTSKRPTATGEISPNEGIAVAVFLIILGLILVFSFGGVVPFLLNFLAVILYDLLYTLILKRKSPFGVMLGGLPGSLPILIGYYSTAGRLDVLPLILFYFMFFWQPPHFWALAIKYKEDYAKANLPVLPLVYGEKFTKVQSIIHSVLLLPAVLIPVFFGFVKPIFLLLTLPLLLGFIGLNILSLYFQIDLKRLFAFSNLLLISYFLAFVLSKQG